MMIPNTTSLLLVGNGGIERDTNIRSLKRTAKRKMRHQLRRELSRMNHGILDPDDSAMMDLKPTFYHEHITNY